MGTIYQRQLGGTWHSQYRLNGRLAQHRLRTTDKAVAKLKLTELEVLLAKGGDGILRRPGSNTELLAGFRIEVIRKKYPSWAKRRNGIER